MLLYNILYYIPITNLCLHLYYIIVIPNRYCDLVVDFEANYDGVNNPKVNELLTVLFNNGYEFYMYLDGDRVGINKKAD